MRSKIFIVTAILLIVIASVSVPGMAAHNDLGSEVLAPNDGWAAFGAGTTGGSLAVPSQVYRVTNRAELIAALNNGVFSSTSPSNPSDEPKIIYVDGTIDMNVDDDNQPLTCEDYYRDGYTLEAFLATYDPAVWGRVAPSGPLEAARLTSRNAQQARVRIRIGSNTTIVGLDKHATIRGGWFDIRGSSSVNRTNIIIRNLTFEDTYRLLPGMVSHRWRRWDHGMLCTTRSHCAIPITSGSITTLLWTVRQQMAPCHTTSACFTRCTMGCWISPMPPIL